jgi:hypothetical protein
MFNYYIDTIGTGGFFGLVIGAIIAYQMPNTDSDTIVGISIFAGALVWTVLSELYYWYYAKK